MAELYSKTYSDIEILALSEVPAPKIAVTIKQGEVLAKGTAIAQVTSSGLYVAYDEDGEDGSEEPAGILAMDVDADVTGENRNVDVAMYIGGAFYLSKLTGVDADVIEALNARAVPGRDLLIF